MVSVTRNFIPNLVCYLVDFIVSDVIVISAISSVHFELHNPHLPQLSPSKREIRLSERAKRLNRLQRLVDVTVAHTAFVSRLADEIVIPPYSEIEHRVRELDTNSFYHQVFIIGEVSLVVISLVLRVSLQVI